MRSKRPALAKYIVPAVIVAAGVFSYFYSGEVYAWYMRTYYEKILGLSAGERVEKAEKMYAAGEYEKLRAYLKTLIIAYPADRELKKLNGLTLIRLGERRKGADMILMACEGGPIPRNMLKDTVLVLFEHGQYRDVLDVFRVNSPGGDPDLLYCFGVSLFQTGRHAKAITIMKKAVERGNRGYRTFHYIGMAHLLSGDSRASLPYLERAWAITKEDPEVARSLSNAYRKVGRYDDAARLAGAAR